MFSAINRRVKRWVLRNYKRRPLVLVSDTTLRDGAQMPGIRLDARDRVRIAAALAQAGVHSIDVGFPAAGEAEVEAIRRVAKAVHGPVLSALARTVASDIDLAAEALSGVSLLKRAVTLFIGTSPSHRRHKHEMSQPQIIQTVVEAVQRAQESFEIISFGAEDASRTEPDFLNEVYREAIEAGATSIGFTDTVGILTPTKVTQALARIQDGVSNIDDALLAVHFHNDLGLATANTLAAVAAGANIIQGTINGIGERGGNVALEEVVVALLLNADEYRKEVTVNPAQLYALCGLVAELTGCQPPANKPIVGRNIFRTEAGIHQDGLLGHPETYLPFPPELIGAGPVQLVLGRHSGRRAVRHHLEAAGFNPTEQHLRLVLDYLKGKEHAPAELAEIEGFLEKLRPFMTEEELRPPDSIRALGGVA